MKAITIWQPWATLIMVGLKEYETRGWKTNYRGPLAIHAGKRSVPLAELLKDIHPHLQETYYAIIRLCGYDPENLPTGCILGTVNLAAICPVEQVKPLLPPREILFGDYGPGRHAWRVDGIQRLKEPIPIAGKQGLWNWEDENG